MNPPTPEAQPSPADLSWFQDQAPLTPPPKKPRRWLKPIIFVTGAAVVTLAVWVIVAFAGQTSACLSNEDYYDLTGTKPIDTLSSKSRFYTDFIAFNPASTTYTMSTSGEPASTVIDRLGKFYTNHRDKKMLFTVGASYATDNDYSLAQTRTLAIVNALIKAGIPTEIITQDIPSLVTPEDTDVTVGGVDAVSISLTSLESCQ